ncbi:MAG: methyltransferase domain-containing protein [Rhodospirillales bacterium]|jgi:trans-aconitate 2-methyltransferase|nr:methyltransferase domain-containing protein [Rhodospirillales bacterium]
MPSWDSTQYLKFRAERQRPAQDLLAGIALQAPDRIFDLGCGAGNPTRLVAARWPQARITGLDSSADMLAKARDGGDDDIEWANIEWVRANLNSWKSPEPADLLYSNAALQWLGDHETLFPRLMDMLSPGGVLAVQMPRNHAAPSHTCMFDAICAGPWATKFPAEREAAPVAAPETYYSILAPVAGRLSIWETIYHQVLEGENPVVEFTRGTALRPILEKLDENERAGFLEEYSARILAAYPPQADGKTLFPFRRLFIVAYG